jgi:hypothetical protein
MPTESVKELNVKYGELLSRIKDVAWSTASQEDVEILEEVVEWVKPLLQAISYSIPVFSHDGIVHLETNGEERKGIYLLNTFEYDSFDSKNLSGELYGLRLVLFEDSKLLLQERIGCWSRWPGIGENLSTEIIQERTPDLEDLLDIYGLETVLANISRDIERKYKKLLEEALKGEAA